MAGDFCEMAWELSCYEIASLVAAPETVRRSCCAESRTKSADRIVTDRVFSKRRVDAVPFTNRAGESRRPPSNSPIRERCCEQRKFSSVHADDRCVTGKAANKRLAWAYKLRAQHFQNYLFNLISSLVAPEGTLEL